MKSLKGWAVVVLLMMAASCALLPPSVRTEAGFPDKSKVPQSFRLGEIKSLNPLLPPVESSQMTNLVTYLAQANGFQVIPGGKETPGPEPLLEVQYNEVGYTQDLSSAQSLTVFLILKDPQGTVIGTVFVWEDSQRTLASWSVLYSLVEQAFQKLKSVRGS